MTKEQLIALMVKNYYAQVAIVGGRTSVSLEKYLRGIFANSPGEYTKADLQYGLSLAR